MKQYKIIITYIILITFILIMYYLNQIVGVLEFILSIFTYTIIFYSLHIVWSKFRKKEILPAKEFINLFLYRISILLLVFTIILGGLSYISNEIYPAKMPEYTISNGKKIIKFQAMSHIGTSKFYNNVRENIIKAKKDGYVYFYEGVKPGKKESLDDFNQAIGIQFNKDLYKNFSKLYGVDYQDNSLFLGLINDKDYNVDVDMDHIMKLYKIKKEKNINSQNTINKEPINVNKEIINTLSRLNQKELKILVYINQAILNFIIGSEKTQFILTNNFANLELFDVILGERNKIISEAIINSKYDKIYMTYGLLHFKGIFNLLRKNDPNWKIISIKNLYPIKK